jgi:hypothetical protein
LTKLLLTYHKKRPGIKSKVEKRWMS